MSERDVSLVNRAKQGDPEAFREIYEEYHQRIFTYVYYRVSEQTTAEDLTSEVFVRVVKNIGSFKYVGRPLLAWLYTIAGNLVRDHHRRAKRIQWMSLEDQDLVSDSDPTKAVDISLDSDLLAEAIGHLTEDQAQILLMKFVDGKSNSEIADVVGKREGAVRALQHRALRSLRSIMEQNEQSRLGSELNG